MYTATLQCGMLLTYEARNFLPALQDVVPCRRHGYCAVQAIGASSGRSTWHRRRRRAVPRDKDEMLEWLQEHPVTTVHVLRRHRFTLKLVTDAQRDGTVQVDLASGEVVYLPARARTASRAS